MPKENGQNEMTKEVSGDIVYFGFPKINFYRPRRERKTLTTKGT